MAIEYGRLQGEPAAPGPARGPRADRQGAARRRHPGPVRGRYEPAGLGRAGGRRGAARPPGRRRGGGRVIRDLRNYIFGLRPGILADRHRTRPCSACARSSRSGFSVVAVAEVDPQVAAELASQAGDVVQLAREALQRQPAGRHLPGVAVQGRGWPGAGGGRRRPRVRPGGGHRRRTGSAQPRAGRAPRWPGRDPQHPGQGTSVQFIPAEPAVVDTADS